MATGGTAKAACNLVEKAGGEVLGVAFVIELTGSLHGRDKLEGYDILSLVKIPVEEWLTFKNIPLFFIFFLILEGYIHKYYRISF